VTARAQQRPVRSFVRRAGRTTRGQARALAELLPRYGVSPDAAPLDWDAVFPSHLAGAPLVLEIGFGMGEALLEMAAAAPTTRFVGVEVYDAGVGALLRGLEGGGIGSGADNVRVLHADVATVLERCFGPGELTRAQVFFPDPWPKKRHHKRRLIQAPFLARLVTRLQPGGELLLATDWAEYAESMRALCEAEPALVNVHGPWRWAPGRGRRPATKFERRGVERGHGVFDLVYCRVELPGRRIKAPGTLRSPG